VTRENQQDGERLKGTLDMMIWSVGMGMGTQSQRSSSTHQKTFWKLSKDRFTPLCIGLRVADGYLLTGARAKTIAKRSSIG
jgi:hypothetical protein